MNGRLDIITKFPHSYCFMTSLWIGHYQTEKKGIHEDGMRPQT